MSRQKKDRVDRYSLVLQDNIEFRDIKAVRFNKMKMIIVLTGILTILVLIIYALIAFTPIRVTIPGYPNEAFRQMAANNAVKIDSLERVMAKWNVYSENISRILLGQETLSLDSLVSGRAERYLCSMNEEQIRVKDSTLRALVAEDERKNLLSSQEKREFNAMAAKFYIPVKGLIINKFDPAYNPGLDISVNPGDMVMSVLDGTVVFAQWTDTDRYVIAIQHQGNLLSIYKRNQKLLLSPGDAVKGGTPVALASGTGVQADNDHIHLELWDNGRAVDPEKFINFQ